LPAEAQVKGTVQVAFTSTATPANSIQLFQSMVLNVIGVRVNPTSGTVSEADKKWQLIPPIGGTSGKVKKGQGRIELAVDLASTQNLAQVLNSIKIPAQTYHHIELVLDPQNPGNFVPLCGTVQPRGEGCISYPATLLNPNVPIQVQGTVSFDVVQNATAPMVLSIDPGIAGVPTGSADSVSINPVITLIPNETFSGGTGNPQMALVSGKVKSPGSKETIVAQVPQTSQVVAKVATLSDGSYALNLPAAVAGTPYDIFAVGTGRSIELKSNTTVFQGQELSGTDFTPISRGSVQVSGTIFDACTGLALQGATVNLLLPDSAVSPTPDCTTATLGQGCVVVAAATTAADGTYILRSTSVSTTGTPEFLQIPNGTPYTIRVADTGYNTGNIALNVVSGGLKCNKSGFKNSACDIHLEHGEIDAAVSLGAVNTGPALNAMVVAEESGTNTMVGLATATIPTGASQSVPTSVFVPDDSSTTDPVASLDFFASVQDSFGTPGTGSPQKASGHAIATAAAVAGAAKCPDQNSLTPASIVLDGATCVGNASVEGTVATPDSGTVVVLASNGVQLMQTTVPTGTGTPGEFNFCAPASTAAGYTAQHFELQPDGSLAPGASVPVTMAAPATIAAPCSGICGNTGTTCLLCTGVSGVSLP
jgi:hypothetical protein